MGGALIIQIYCTSEIKERADHSLSLPPCGAFLWVLECLQESTAMCEIHTQSPGDNLMAVLYCRVLLFLQIPSTTQGEGIWKQRKPPPPPMVTALSLLAPNCGVPMR